MSKMLKRRKVLKLLPSTILAPSILSTISINSCAPSTKDDIDSVILSTWVNENANNTAFESIQNGNNIIDSIVDGISTVESDIMDTSVGKGGLPDRDGNVTLDACIMDHSGEAGGVCYLKDIEHPIQVAKAVMYDTPHVLLAGEGAKKFALEKGFSPTNLLTPQAIKKWEEWKKKSVYKPIPNSEMHDTIGMIGLSNNKLGGGCSTSGLAFKLNGRVGDSPIIGAGLFVDGEVGAATATGMGELMMKSLSSFLVVEQMRAGKTPKEACKAALQRIDNKSANKDAMQVGLIAIDKYGNTGAYSMMSGFVYAKTINGKTTIETADFLHAIEEK